MICEISASHIVTSITILCPFWRRAFRKLQHRARNRYPWLIAHMRLLSRTCTIIEAIDVPDKAPLFELASACDSVASPDIALVFSVAPRRVA